MSNDPFERFERSRHGLLVPVLLFIAGAVPTALAIRAMNALALAEEASMSHTAESQPVVEAPVLGEAPARGEASASGEIDGMNATDAEEPSQP